MLQVIGAGFGRTGTLSLKAALEQLGAGPCYHMTEVFQHPEHLPIWEAATGGEPVDWEALFAGYHATVDWPAAAFYDRLVARYPEAKVLLSVRDPLRWYESVANTIYQASRLARAEPLPNDDPAIQSRRRAGQMINALIWQGTFGGAFEDRERAIAIYEAHNRAVQERVPAHRLLVFDVRDGWDPLCRFLGAPIPADTPFPHLNDSASFIEMTRGR
jgi:hypothetical protein